MKPSTVSSSERMIPLSERKDIRVRFRREADDSPLSRTSVGCAEDENCVRRRRRNRIGFSRFAAQDYHREESEGIEKNAVPVCLARARSWSQLIEPIN